MFISSLFHWPSVDAERPSDIVDFIDCIFHSFVGLLERMHPEIPHIEDLLYLIFLRQIILYLSNYRCLCMCVYAYIYNLFLIYLSNMLKLILLASH